MNNKTKGITVVIVAALILSVWIVKNQSEKGLLSSSQTESSILKTVKYKFNGYPTVKEAFS